MDKGIVYLFTSFKEFGFFVNDYSNSLIIGVLEEFPLWRIFIMKAKSSDGEQDWNLMIGDGGVYIYVDNMELPSVVMITHAERTTSNSNIKSILWKNKNIHLLNDESHIRKEALGSFDFKTHFIVMAIEKLKCNLDQYIGLVKPFYNSLYAEDLDRAILQKDNSPEVTRRIKTITLLSRK